MAIRNRLSTIMGERRLKMSAIFERTGLSRSTISDIYYDRTTRIDYETLNKLCEMLNCQPGDLLVFEKDEKPENAS